MNTINFKIENNIYTLKKVSGEMWSIADHEGSQDIDLLHLALILNYLEKDLYEIYSKNNTLVTVDVFKNIKTVKLLKGSKVIDKKVNTFNDFANKFWIEDPKVIDTINFDDDNRIYCGEFNPYNYYKMIPLILQENGWIYRNIPKIEILTSGYNYPVAETIGFYLKNKRLPNLWGDFLQEEEDF